MQVNWEGPRSVVGRKQEIGKLLAVFKPNRANGVQFNRGREGEPQPYHRCQGSPRTPL